MIATLIVLVAIEGAARIYEPIAAARVDESLLPKPGNDAVPGAARLPANPGAIPLPAGGAGWGFPPNSQVSQGNVIVEINSLGIRGPEPGEPRDESALRLLSLGDSSVFGYGVRWEQVMTSVAAAQLTESLGRPAEPFTGAIPGHSSDMSRWVLENIGQAVDPDWVIVANQWSDMFHEGGLGWGAEHPLAIYRVAYQLLGPWLKPRQIGWVDPGRGVGTPQAGRAPRVGVAPYMRTLRTICEMSRDLGAEVMFLVLPAPIDLASGGAPPYIREYREAMRFVADDMGAPVAEGPARFAARDASNAMFFDTVHPSVSGHALLGELIAEVIEEAE